MLEHLVLRPRAGIGNRMRAIASAKRLCARVGARFTLLWDWGDYRRLFDDEVEWLSSTEEIEWQAEGYRGIRHLRRREGGRPTNRRVPVASDPRILLQSCHVFAGDDEPPLRSEREVLDWLPRPAAAVRERVEEFRRTRFRGPTAGIHMRRGDNPQAILRSPDRAFWREADRRIRSGHDLFLATDGVETARGMEARYGSRLLRYDPRSPAAARWPRPIFDLEATIDDMVELWLLVACDVVIGSSGSSYSRIAVSLNGSADSTVIDVQRLRWLESIRRFLGRPA
jgi:hypothetical protein